MVSTEFKQLISCAAFPLAILISATSASGAQSSDTAGSASNSSKQVQSGQASEKEDAPALPPADDAPPAKSVVHVRIAVPQMDKCTEAWAVYPYVTKPPKILIPLAPLPEEDLKDLRMRLIQTGYANRQSLTRAYPEQGWRWQYAYRNALKRSGLSEPKFVVGVYRFAEEMTKYIRPECERINRIEEGRRKRYEAMLVEYEDNHKDEESEAIRLNREPIKLPVRLANKGRVVEGTIALPPGEWYITGKHKVPGLLYYWQERIKVNSGENIALNLTDANALCIQGGY